MLKQILCACVANCSREIFKLQKLTNYRHFGSCFIQDGKFSHVDPLKENSLLNCK